MWFKVCVAWTDSFCTCVEFDAQFNVYIMVSAWRERVSLVMSGCPNFRHIRFENHTLCTENIEDIGYFRLCLMVSNNLLKLQSFPFTSLNR